MAYSSGMILRRYISEPRKGRPVDPRERKGLEIAARMRVVKGDGGRWSVPSTTTDKRYSVDPDTGTCTCDDYGTRGGPCKHVYAVRFVREREEGKTVPVPANTAPAPARPTYKQAWPAYVKAQTTEKNRFLPLLADLCRGIEEPPREKVGRKPVPLADAVFACCYKVYSGFSARRFNCDLEDAHSAGYVSRRFHPHKISGLMDNPDLAPVLTRLIRESARPLAAVEVDFAADSSGFTTSRFVRWYDMKYGVERKMAEWVKTHIMCGVKTNVVTAVEIRDKDASDTKLLPDLVNATAAHFTMREVSADKGYGSLANYDAVAGAGATPFIAFKSIHTGRGGGLWEKMYHYFMLNREEYLTHYHKRSNVESTFSAVKRKFGDSVRSKADAAMVNEVLCKFLCHNVVTLIHEQEELGITPEFWGTGPADEEMPRLLRFPGA